MTTMRCEAVATIFSRSSAPPPPLMRRSSLVDLVGAVDGEVEEGRVIERGERNAEPLGLLRASPPRSART